MSFTGWALRMRVVLAAGVLLGAACAHAELWTYMDERGITHFASSQLDPRYAEFAARAAGGRSGPPVRAGVPTQAPSSGPAPVPLATYLSGMPGYSEARLHLQAASEIFGVDMVLLQALVATESGFDPGAVSPKGAVGLMQVMPATAARYGLTAESEQAASDKLKDPSVNVNMGTRYLRDLLALFGGDRTLALAAYNAGEGAVKKAGNRVPDFKETQNYVKTVLQLVDGLGGAPGNAAPLRAPGVNSVVQTIGAKVAQPGRFQRVSGPGAGIEMITDRASAQSSVVATGATPKN
jgi:hypothetical protein